MYQFPANFTSSIRILAASVFIALLAFASTAQAAQACSKEQKVDADKEIWLSPADRKKAISKHLPWGLPNATIPVSNEQVLAHRDYIINYDHDLLVAVWTAHRLDAEGLGKIDRVDCFRQDPRLNAPTASLPSDYDEPIFDQGHLTPNGDMSYSLIAVLNSFVMSNMTPQYCQFNRGVWQIFESMVRLWAKDRKTVYVITGSVFDRNNDSKRDADTDAKHMKSRNGKSRVAVPSHFYKILAAKRADGGLDTLTLLLPHNQTDVDGEEAIRYLQQHIRSIKDLEAVTGLKFFSGGSSVVHEASAPSLWPYTGKPSRSLVDDRCRATAGADR